MKVRALAVGAVVGAVGLAFGGAARADVPLEWDAAVTAMESVDPTLPVPVFDSAAVVAVGGGRVDLGAGSSPRFGFGATATGSGFQGEMTISSGVPATLFHADVTCLAAATTGTGGAIATVIGVVDPPQPEAPFLVFTLNDGGPPDGTGDAWDGFFTAIPPPCVALPAGGQIVGNIVISVP